MQPYSDYEIAQRRINERQNKKSQFRTSLVFLAIPIFITLISNSTAYCTIPFAILAGILAIMSGIELYYTAPEHAPNEAEINQEIDWLFGEDWHNEATAQARAFAQDRIRKRRIGRWRFVAHLLVFVPINGAIIISAIKSIASATARSNYVDGPIFLVVAFLWLVIFIADVRSTFPTKQALEKREINFGKTLHFELARLQPEKLKNKEKLKRGKYYVVGDDGELEEVEDEVIGLEEKPKHQMKKD